MLKEMILSMFWSGFWKDYGFGMKGLKGEPLDMSGAFGKRVENSQGNSLETDHIHSGNQNNMIEDNLDNHLSLNLQIKILILNYS